MTSYVEHQLTGRKEPAEADTSVAERINDCGRWITSRRLVQANIRDSLQPLSHSFLQQFDDSVNDADIPRFIHDHKAALRFPDILFLLLVHAEREATRCGRETQEACIGWSANGRAVIIRDKDELVKRLLPTAFCIEIKFASFLRKLYRWGFRQAARKSSIKCSRVGEKVFLHAFFRRDNKALIANMTSTTAERTRNLLKASSSVQHEKARSSDLRSDQRYLLMPDQSEAHNKPIWRPDQFQKISDPPLARVDWKSSISVVGAVTDHLRVENYAASIPALSLRVGNMFARQQNCPSVLSADQVSTVLLGMAAVAEPQRQQTLNLPLLCDSRSTIRYGRSMHVDSLSNELLLQHARARALGLTKEISLETFLHTTRGVPPTKVLYSLLHESAET